VSECERDIWGGDQRSSQAREVNARLLAKYGAPEPCERMDPLSELVATILSQHTSDTNSARAFSALMEHFGSFEAVRTASVEEIEAAVRPGGLGWVKAQRIKRVLEEIQASEGRLDLDFLNLMELAEARQFLTRLSGVGPKTAACVLLFACGRPAIPVDTHVHRVSRRLGLIGPRTSAEQAQAELEAIVPTDQAYNFHVNLIRHGRETCKAPRPRCWDCPLDSICPKVGVSRKDLDRGASRGEVPGPLRLG
jgi:endonuclease-3